MAKPFSLGIVADVSQFIRESGKVADQLETIADGLEEMADTSDREAAAAADALEQIGDAATDAGKDLADGIEDGAKDAEKAVDRSADDMEDSLKKISDSSEDAGKDLADGIEDGAKDAEKAVDRSTGDMETALKTVGTEAGTAGKELAKEIDTGSDKAAKSTDNFSEKARAALEKLRDKARDTGRSIDDEVSDGAHDAGAAMGELKEEAGSVGREAATSFSGEFEDVTDIVRDIAAEAFVGFGPAAATAGMAAAAGIGLIVEAINNAKERAEEAQARFETMVAALASGDTDEFGDYVKDQMMKIVSGADDAIASMDQVEGWLEILGDAGITTADLLGALAGDAGALERVRAAMDETGNTSELMYKQLTGQDLNPTERAMLDLNNALTETETATKNAEEAAGYYEDAVRTQEGAVGGLKGITEEHTGTMEDQVPVLEEIAGKTGEVADELEREQQIREELAAANRNYAEILADQDDALQAYTDTIKENNATYEDQEQLRIENTAALAELSGALLDESDAAEEAGISGERLTEIQQQNYQDFMNAAAAAGYTADEARQLAEDFGLVPRKVETEVKQTGANEVARALINIRDRQNALQKKQTIQVDYQLGNLGAQIRNQIARIGVVRVPAVANVIGKVFR